MYFPALKKIIDTYVRILVAVYANTFLTIDITYSEFAQLIKAIEENNRTVPLHKDCSDNDDLSNIHKQIQVVADQYFTEEDNKQLAIFQKDITINTPLAARLVGSAHFDTITTIVFVESLFPIKFAIFLIVSSLLLLVSDIFAFALLWVLGN